MLNKYGVIPADPRRVLEDEFAMRSMLILSNLPPLERFLLIYSNCIVFNNKELRI
jgi:hypothetical protein